MTTPLQLIADFVTIDPPLRHHRQSYRDPCYQGCKACVFEEKRKAAVDAVLKLQIEEDPNFGQPDTHSDT